MVQKIKIVYKCNYGNCNKEYKCDVGFFARVDCEHKDAEGTLMKWYPVKIVRIEYV